jgi:hypothetical protein
MEKLICPECGKTRLMIQEKVRFVYDDGTIELDDPNKDEFKSQSPCECLNEDCQHEGVVEDFYESNAWPTFIVGAEFILKKEVELFFKVRAKSFADARKVVRKVFESTRYNNVWDSHGISDKVEEAAEEASRDIEYNKLSDEVEAESQKRDVDVDLTEDEDARAALRS